MVNKDQVDNEIRRLQTSEKKTKELLRPYDELSKETYHRGPYKRQKR